MAHVQTVNIGRPVPTIHSSEPTTCIDKIAVDGPVQVSAPGPRTAGPPGGSGLAGDAVSDRVHHGGDDQAVYAYAREDLDLWESRLHRPLRNGFFGENLTTVGVDLGACLIGEQWRLGPELVLEVSCPRIPCQTFTGQMDTRGWVKDFTRVGRVGAYLRVIRPGQVQAGDRIEIAHRPDHAVTIGLTFRALTTEPGLLPMLEPASALPAKDREKVARRLAASEKSRASAART